MICSMTLGEELHPTIQLGSMGYGRRKVLLQCTFFIMLAVKSPNGSMCLRHRLALRFKLLRGDIDGVGRVNAP